MKKIFFLFLILPVFLFSACKKLNNTTVARAGLYKPYKQEISPIHAQTKSGQIDGSKITLTPTNIINGTGNTGSIYFENFDLKDPLRESKILIDSIKLSENGDAYFYPNILKIQRKYVEIKDSIFLIPTDTSLNFVTLDSCCTNFTIITDHKKANFYLTTNGTTTQNGFVLYHYDILIITNSGVVYGVIDANYLDLNYLTQLLHKKDTLVYVKKSTYFERN